MSACRSCGAEIIWARTARGKMMPLDFEPGPLGNVVVDLTGKIPKVVEVLPMAPAMSGLLYVPHFASCPYAKEHRR